MDDTLVLAPMLGTVVRVPVGVGDTVRSGQTLVVLESMKMEHLVAAPHAGVVGRVLCAEGETVQLDQRLVVLREQVELEPAQAGEADAELDVVRPDLAEVRHRHEIGLDAARPDAVARRRGREQRTARENVAACAIRARSSSTARWWWPRSGNVGRWRN
jgi:pyruvate/2-oxoglutarate dehydrogenase complex dihydrolipoamide acyltransferase (E2) component